VKKESPDARQQHLAANAEVRALSLCICIYRSLNSSLPHLFPLPEPKHARQGHDALGECPPNSPTTDKQACVLRMP
jgi:hypothetical protein